MGTFSENLRAIRMERGLSQEALAELLGTSKQVISRYENGQRSPKISVAARYAHILGVSLSTLNGEAEALLPHPDLLPVVRRRIPLLGETSGETCILPDAPGEDIPACDFALRVTDDSMQPRFLPGDTVFIRSQAEVSDGQVAAVQMGEHILLRRIYRLSGGMQLVAENPACAPVILQNGEDARIIGTAVRFSRNL